MSHDGLLAITVDSLHPLCYFLKMNNTNHLIQNRECYGLNSLEMLNAVAINRQHHPGGTESASCPVESDQTPASASFEAVDLAWNYLFARTSLRLSPPGTTSCAASSDTGTQADEARMVVAGDGFRGCLPLGRWKVPPRCAFLKRWHSSTSVIPAQFALLRGRCD
jgi:hypothetical protein